MATLTNRTTLALDNATLARIRDLSILWKVPQAEVVRRAVSSAYTPAPEPCPKSTFEDFLRSGNGLDAKAASQYLEEVREDRQTWGLK